MKNSSDNFRNQTRVLPACNAVPPANEAPRAPEESAQHASCSLTCASGPYSHCKAASSWLNLVVT